MSEQGHHQHHGLGRGAQPIEDGAFAGAERLVTRVADEALLLLRMDTDIALACLASGRAMLIGAECRRGVHACPPSSVGERTKRSMSGPPFALQVHLPTVACGATQDTLANNNLKFMFLVAPIAHVAPVNPDFEDALRRRQQVPITGLTLDTTRLLLT